MIHIDEGAIYSRAEAEELLASVGIGLRALFEHFDTHSNFRNVIMGTELLAIMRLAGEVVAQRAHKPLTSSEVVHRTQPSAHRGDKQKPFAPVRPEELGITRSGKY